MADQSPHPASCEIQESTPRSVSSASGRSEKPTPDVHNTAAKLQRVKEVYKAYEGHGEKPSAVEILGWCFYELCSSFVLTVLVPIVFPLIISQIGGPPLEPDQGWFKSFLGLDCAAREMQLYEKLTQKSIKVGIAQFSPLTWTSISWALGLILAAPVLALASFHLDYGFNQHIISLAAVAAGAISCLPTGVFKTTKIFPLYIVAIVVAHSVAFTSHTRHFGLMVRSYAGPTIRKRQFSKRRVGSGLVSSCSAAVGGLGSAAISAFTYHMLRRQVKEGEEDHFLSLWIVSIFSGLKWLLGIFHIFTTKRSLSVTIPSHSENHILSIFKFPHAVGSVISGGLLSSFSTMSIFTGALLYLIGKLCFEPIFILYLWLTYFLFPLISLPLLQQLQKNLIKSDATNMKILGFVLSAATSGTCFYFHGVSWRRRYVFIFAGIQGTAAALLHAFGRVLLIDSSPAGKEGAFSMWFSWTRGIGICMGFTTAAIVPGNLQVSAGVAFCGAVLGGAVLIFGNIRDYGGAVAAGHVKEESEKGSSVSGLDTHSVSKDHGSP